MKLYARTGCQNCPLQSQCTKADRRWISRHFYEEALERTAGRVRENPHLMRRRSAVVERPFAHLKQIMGLRRFQCWGKEGAKAELTLFNPEKNWTFTPKDIRSKSKNTPFVGEELVGKAITTIA